MEGIKTLVKLRKKQLDEKSLRLKELNSYYSRVEQALNDAKEELETQKQFADETFKDITSNFISENLNKQKFLEQELSQINNMIEIEKDEIMEIYSEIKKYEIVLENKCKALKFKEEKKEQFEADELNIKQIYKNS